MRLRNDLILREMGNEYVIVDPSKDVVDMSKVFTMNETAAFIWRELKELDFTIETVAKILTNHYEVDDVEALADADNLLKQFEIEGLLEE